MSDEAGRLVSRMIPELNLARFAERTTSLRIQMEKIMSMTTTTSVMKDALRTRPLKGAGHTSKRSASEQKVAEYAERISQGWQKTVGSIWNVAEDCFFAKKDFTASEKRDLIARLPFGESMFSKLASIGGDKRLKEHRDTLPPSISTMDILRKLSDEQFEIARTKGLVGATREDVKRWTQGNNEKSARKTSRDLELPVALTAFIRKSFWMGISISRSKVPSFPWQRAKD